MMNFTESPVYQRMMQRMQRIKPEHRAILNDFSADAKFADEQTRKELASLSQQNNVDYANRSLDLRSKEFNTSMGLRRDAFDYDVKQGRIATGVGLGQVAMEDYYGRKREDVDLETVRKKKLLESLYGGGK